MRVHTRDILWVTAIICAAAAAGTFANYVARSADSFSGRIEKIVECVEAPSPVVCARPFIQELVRAGDSAVIIDELVAKGVPPASCHFLAHLVGQEIYRLTQSSEIAISKCSRACGAGCVHGAIGEAFVEEAGLDEEVFDPAHLSEKDLIGVGKRLCKSSTACHGVGHALLQRSSVSIAGIEEVLPVCRNIASGQQVFDCYSGIYMEYSDTLSSRSAWEDETALDVSQDSLPRLCDRALPAESRACFLYFPTIMHEVLTTGGLSESREVTRDRVESVCLNLEDPNNRTACFYGLGASYFQSVIAGELDPVLDRCARLEESSASVTCMLGAAFMTLEYKENRQAVAYCAAIPSADTRLLCYRSVFSRIQLTGGDLSEARAFCPDHDEKCFESVSEYATPSRQQ